MSDFQLPKGALLPLLTATLSDDNGAINLTGATVKFQMRLPGSSTLKVDAAAAVTNAAAGQVTYTWVTADTDTIGLYVGWFLVTFTAKNLYAPEPPLVIQITRGASGAG
jgi:hypothetical protein